MEQITTNKCEGCGTVNHVEIEDEKHIAYKCFKCGRTNEFLVVEVETLDGKTKKVFAIGVDYGHGVTGSMGRHTIDAEYQGDTREEDHENR